MASSITVNRSGAGQGTISFGGESKPCWENVGNLIPAKTYTGCKAAYMVEKGRKGIAIPNEQTGKDGIYIHEGTDSSWSGGCIVTDKAFVEKMWSALWANGADDATTVTVSGGEGN